MFGKMADVIVKLFKGLMWIVLITLSVQTVVSAEKKCVQTVCDVKGGYCCAGNLNSTAAVKPCCCTSDPTRGFSIFCSRSNHSSVTLAWDWIVLIVGVVLIIVGVVGYLIYRRRRRAYASI
ncbi:uncharacterized protein LOC128224653 isoform X1 [Mya arenaria]|uniref:uncharacterized protein LOC128224653 isoform X1 n=1 Tax=Mya arenaria TaxID=6604 RepID=UPI0022E2617E|nr:uncharacterized protein LOC128224653 isoform X1 [Mya arenaria]